MEVLLYILAKTVSIYLSAVYISMFLRVLLQFFVDVDKNPIYLICCYISEPFIVPFRFILEKLNIGQNSPIDVGYITASIAVCVLSFILPAI